MLLYYEDLLIFIVALFYIAFGVSVCSMRRFHIGLFPWGLLGLCFCFYGVTVWITLGMVRAHLPFSVEPYIPSRTGRRLPAHRHRRSRPASKKDSGQ